MAVEAYAQINPQAKELRGMSLLTPESNSEDQPNLARMYDYLLGGHRNRAIDREAAQRIIAVEPDFALMLRANRGFLYRAVTFTVHAGIRQFLDVGSGMPTVRDVHHVAQSLDPACRVVYVDSDPVAIALGREMLADDARVAAIEADALQPDHVLHHPHVAAMLDLRQPVAVLLVPFLHYVADDATALQLIGRWRDAVASGSYLVISHPANIFAERSAATRAVFNRASSPVTLRSREQIARFFEGFDLVEPGLVPTPLWRPDFEEALFVSEPERAQAYAGVARKPQPAT